MYLSAGKEKSWNSSMFSFKTKNNTLDEPFAGIDPLAIEDIKNVLKGLSNKVFYLITDRNLKKL